MRIEKDFLGEKAISDEFYYGIHTVRSLENFSISNLKWQDIFIKSLALVKKAAAITNKELKYLDEKIADAIISACDKVISGEYYDQFVTNPYQGGAGTSLNMNMNEVLANIALELLNHKKGEYEIISPLNHVNLHQSTNDVIPTAFKVAGLYKFAELERKISELQEIFQKKEKEFAGILKIGRTQLQDAVPMTLGQEFSAYSEAISRDRWRVFKCEERFKIVNLGGTAIGTGLTAPKKYIFKVNEVLRKITNLNVTRGENLIDATQNNDEIIEVSGIIRAHANNLFKIASDLRLLSSGPYTGFGDIILPARQAGSSIMPGKINPVIPEMVNQAAMKVFANDYLINFAVSQGQLELNAFMPIIIYHFLENLELMINTDEIFKNYCVKDIQANHKILNDYVENSESIITALVPYLGYEKVSEIIKISHEMGISPKSYIIKENILTFEEYNAIINPSKMYELGHKDLNNINK